MDNPGQNHQRHFCFQFFLAVLILCLALCGAMGCGDSQKTKMKHYQKGVLLSQRGRYAEAVGELQKAVAIDPSMGEAHLELGRCYRNLHYYEQALSALETARRMNSGLMLPALLQIADIYVETDKFALAEDVALQALQDHQDNADVLMFLGKLNWEQEKPEMAGQWLRKAAAADPKRTEPHLVLAEISMNNREYDQAEEHLKQATILDPENSAAKLALAKIYRLTAKEEQAAEMLEQVLKNQPNNVTAIGALAEVYYSQEKLADARIQAEKFIKASPGNPYANSLYGAILLKTGEYDEAVLYLTKAAGAPSASSKEQYLLGLALKQTGKPAQAVSAFQKALTLDPENSSARLMLADSFLAEGSFEKAQRELKRLLSEEPENESARQLSVRATALQSAFEHVETMLSAEGMPDEMAKSVTKCLNAFRINDLQAAHLACEELLKKDPNSAIALNLKGLIHLKKNELEQALALFHQACTSDPLFAASYINAANVYIAIGSYPAAARSFKKAMALSPKDPVIRLRYVRALFLMKEHEQAEEFLKNLILEEPDRVQYRRALADLLINMKKYSEARVELAALLKADPKNVDAAVLLAESLAKQGDLRRAAGNFEALARAVPQSKYLRERLALCHLALGDTKRAQEVLVSQEQDQDASGLVPALLMQEEGRYDDAERMFSDLQKDAYGENPYEIMIMNVRSLQTDELASTDLPNSPFVSKAFVKSYASMLKNQDFSAEQVAELNLALALARVQWVAAALERLERLSVEIKPSGALMEMIGSLLESEKRLDEARRKYETAIALEPQYWPAYYRLGLLAAGEGQREESVAYLQAAIKQKPDSLTVLLALARAYEVAGKDAEAVNIYRKINQLQPDLPPVLNNLAWLLAKNPETLAQALQLAQSAVTAQPLKAATRDTLGWIYFQKGELEKAREHLDKAVLFDSFDPSIRYHRGMVFFKLGQADKALQDFKEAGAATVSFPERALAEQMLKQLG